VARKKNLETFAPWGLLIASILLWQLICAAFDVSEFVFPSPLQIVRSLIEFAVPIAEHAWRTFWTTMVGFAISIVVGVVLGFVIGSSRLAYAAMYPLMTAFNALPKAAFVPILVVWFGIGVGPAILTAFLISFFPIMVNIATGLATLEPALFLRLAEGGDHARLRRHDSIGDERFQRRHRLPAHLGRLGDENAAGFRGSGGHRGDGHGDVRTVLLDRAPHHRLGTSRAVVRPRCGARVPVPE
jgi:hypothetical protein